jgi:hypothetical protein
MTQALSFSIQPMMCETMPRSQRQPAQPPMQKYGTGFFLKDLLPCYGYEVAPVATCSQRFRRPVAEPAQIPMKIHRLSAEVPHLSCWPAPRAANR